MALSRVKVWSSGEVLTASDLNAEFSNILNNPITLWSPAASAVDFDGQTITLDAAAVTTVASSASVSWNFTSGAKTGTPATTGSVANWSAQTFTDNATAGSGTATAFVAHGIQRPTLAATNASVTTTDAATLYIANAPAAGTNETLTNAYALWIDDGRVRLDPSATVVSAASATLDAVNITAQTATITGSTNITTATGVNFVNIGTPTLSAASALTVTNAATVYIAAAPTGAGAGPATITNAYALWVDAGNVRFDADVSAATVSGAVVATQANMESASATNLVVSPGRQQFHPSAAKAWIDLEPTATPAINASYNVTSLTDAGTGLHTVNFTTAFSASTYARAGGRDDPGDGQPARIVTFASSTAGGSSIATCSVDAAGAQVREDSAINSHAAFFGDQ